ncbi:MAG: hypothetical protein CL816_04115 [Coxiellaceae bacterium]|nr:hypothetical protein [Coxiellaceae bacterium]|tara:strand:+ start:582 stop:1811 length:1230 start_codon:yes stop_codon:yes gene_type:complete
MSNPFEFNRIGRVREIGKTIVLRKYPNVQWEKTTLDNGEIKYERKVYSEDRYKTFTFNMDNKEIEEFNNAHEKQIMIDSDREQKLKTIRKPLQNTHKTNDFKKELTRGVLQGEFGVTDGNDAIPILGTFGAGPCLIVAIYESEKKSAFLTHIDASTCLDSFNRELSRLNYNPRTSQVHLYGGDSSSHDMCMDVYEIMENKGFVIVNSDIVREETDSASFAIDARNGNVYSNVNSNDLDTPNIDARLTCRGLGAGGVTGLSKIYDSRIYSSSRESSPKEDEEYTATEASSFDDNDSLLESSDITISSNELNKIINSYKSKHPLNIFNIRPSSEIAALRELVGVPRKDTSFTREEIAKCIESARSCKSQERAQIIRGEDSFQKPTSNGTDEVLMRIQKMLSTPKIESQHSP